MAIQSRTSHLQYFTAVFDGLLSVLLQRIYKLMSMTQHTIEMS